MPYRLRMIDFKFLFLICQKFEKQICLSEFLSAYLCYLRVLKYE